MIGSEIESFVAPWLAACLIAVYLAPALIAFNRKVPNRVSVAVINVFLGWTFVGWVVALAMAVRSVPTKEAVTEAPPGGGA